MPENHMESRKIQHSLNQRLVLHIFQVPIPGISHENIGSKQQNDVFINVFFIRNG